MIVHEWDIEKIEVIAEAEGVTDVVYTIFWKLTSSLGNLSFNNTGSVQLDFNPTNTDFVPYTELTKGIVLGWVKGALGDAMVSDMEAHMVKLLTEATDRQIVDRELPWATPVEEPILTQVNPQLPV